MATGEQKKSRAEAGREFVKMNVRMTSTSCIAGFKLCPKQAGGLQPSFSTDRQSLCLNAGSCSAV